MLAFLGHAGQQPHHFSSVSLLQAMVFRGIGARLVGWLLNSAPAFQIMVCQAKQQGRVVNSDTVLQTFKLFQLWPGPIDSGHIIPPNATRYLDRPQLSTIPGSGFALKCLCDVTTGRFCLKPEIPSTCLPCPMPSRAQGNPNAPGQTCDLKVTPASSLIAALIEK